MQGEGGEGVEAKASGKAKGRANSGNINGEVNAESSSKAIHAAQTHAPALHKSAPPASYMHTFGPGHAPPRRQTAADKQKVTKLEKVYKTYKS